MPSNSTPQADSTPSGRSPQVIFVPLSQLLANPDNPRHFTQQQVYAMCASILEIGLKTKLKVRPLTDAEKTAHPGYLYLVLGGNIRLAGATKAGLDGAWVEVLDVTPEEGVAEAIYDNLSDEMSWFDKYQTIETLINLPLPKKLTQQQVGARVKVDRTLVSKALKLLSLLSSSAGKLIGEQFTLPEDQQVTQRAIYLLTDLAKGTPEDKANIEAALKVVMDRQMNEAQVKKLVIWIQKGNSPESFPADGKLAVKKGDKNQRFDPADPNAGLWKTLPKGAQIRKTPKGYKLTWSLSETDAPIVVTAALAKLKAKADEQSSSAKVDSYIKRLESGHRLGPLESLSFGFHGSKKLLAPVAKGLSHLSMKVGKGLIKTGEKVVKKEIRKAEHPHQGHSPQ